jgi:hypothetical protein
MRALARWTTLRAPGTRFSGRAWLAAGAGPAMPMADTAAAKPVKARVILRIRVLSCSRDGSANRRLDRTPRLPLTRVVDRRCSPKTTTLCSACGSCLLPGASTTTDSGGAELNAPGMRIGPPARRVGTPHPRVPGRRAWEVITPESCLPRSWSTSWLQGRPGRDGQPQTPASAAELMTTPATRYGRKQRSVSGAHGLCAGATSPSGSWSRVLRLMPIKSCSSSA